MSKVIEYKVPIKKYRQLIFVFGAASTVLAILILSLPVLAILKPDFQFHQEFIGYFIFFPIFSMYSMWLTFGYEKVIINNQSIELLKSNRIFTKRKTYPISEVKSIRVIEKRFKSDKWIDAQRERIREKQRAFPFWIRMGQLKLITKNVEVTFFNGLSNTESQLMKEKIENEIKKLKNNKDVYSS